MVISRWQRVVLLVALGGCTQAPEEPSTTRARPAASEGADTPAATSPDASAEGPAAGGSSAPAPTPTPSAEPAPSPPAPVVDAGAPPVPPPPARRDAFAGAGTFTAQRASPSTSLIAAHALAGGVTGKDCLGCHSSGGVARRKPFAAGGTVYEDATGTATASSVELRFVSSAGAEIASVHTDGSGNFWVEAGEVTGTFTGVRDGASAHTMQTPLPSGACNGCHDGTTTAVIYLR